jgi:hypothetical protein
VVAWRDPPEPWKTVNNRFWRRSHNGTLTMLIRQVRVIADKGYSCKAIRAYLRAAAGSK